MKKHFRNIVKTALILVYLVIVAGAIVRMTGSGMGCPDWPKCFGYYIPPTEEAQLLFKPNHDYKKGIVIIKDESLLVASKDFTSSISINIANWEPYKKHDYAIFNATHTWVEYINRLTGALSGIPILIFTILSFWFWKNNKWITLLSLLTLFGILFQAWLGKTVVDSNLAPYKITIHMVMALVIVALILYLIKITSKHHKNYNQDTTFTVVVVVAIALSLIQIALGTQVRQFVDEQIKTLGNIKSNWLNNPSFTFYIHRSFSIIVLLINLWLFYINKKLNLGFQKINYIIIFILLEIISGVAMSYFNFPFSSQSIHIVIATLLFGVQFYIFLETRNVKIVSLPSEEPSL